MRLAALAILLLAGCATLEEEAAQVRDAWQGAFYDDVVKRWGAPNRSATLQDGSQVHTWVSESQASYGSSGPTVGVGVGGCSNRAANPVSMIRCAGCSAAG